MTTATMTRPISMIDFISDAEEGQKATIITDNDYYGITVMKSGDVLLNDRTKMPMPIKLDFLFKSKVKLVTNEKQIPLLELVDAYQKGFKIKIVLGNQERIIQKSVETEELKQLLSVLPFVSVEEIITLKELCEGKFYIAE